MQYLIENSYTKKLYEQLKGSSAQLLLLSMAEITQLEPGHCIVVDEGDLESYEGMHYLASEVIVLTEKSTLGSQSRDGMRYVKKYQSTRQILTLVTRSAFPMTFLVFAANRAENEAIIDDVTKKYDIDTIISLNFNPQSTFSLFDSLVRFDTKVANQTILDVITNMQDYLNPPISDLILFVNQLKEQSRLLIVSAPLKGALDSAFMDLSDTIILVDNDKTKKLAAHLSHRLRSKHFEVMTYD